MFSCANEINKFFRGDSGGRPPPLHAEAQRLQRVETAGARAGREESRGRRFERLPADSGKT